MQNRSSIRWNCRRGKLELDIMLGRFIDRHLDSLNVVDLADFERFLDLPDEVMLDFLLVRAVPADTSFARLTQLIRDCN